MTDDDDKRTPLQAGLDSVADGPAIIAAELRLMAAGDDRYQRFTYMSPWIKNIWNAAADIIEDSYKSKLH
ncbi:hypothetical protein [Micavibrio aeruginosavorus]|uniref:hypothetical protein n=1 Tax=Micavibrio aeruginosavorus TaxID=349221 RepID=UPI00059F0579|nr:hypothetical protein [Micavibrio aeruginosavorus]